MAYKITFTDRTVLFVETAQGDKLKEAQMQSKPPVYVDINKNQYKLDKVSKIEYIADEPVATTVLPVGNKCRGEKSIHKIIYNLFKKELEKPEPRTWEVFRQTAYDHLYTVQKEWCDTKKGTCFCKKSGVEKIVEMFPGTEIVS